MKHLFFLLTLLVFTSANMFSQAIDSTLFQAGWGNLNYAVPESPAFKILDVSADNIMRPTQVRDIGISVGNYFFSNGAVLPKNLAVEVAPSLFNPKVSFANYNKNRIWYTSSASVGTKVNEDGSYAIGVGLKFRLIDKTDLRNNATLTKYITQLGPIYNEAFYKAINEIADIYQTKHSIKTHQLALEAVSKVYGDINNSEYKQIKTDLDEKINEQIDVEKISKFRDSIKNKLWNATVWDVGVASLFNSKDSLIKSLSAPSKLGIWTTIGVPLGEKEQILFGINGQLKDSGSSKLNVGYVNIGTKIYYGQNDFKGFLQGELNSQKYMMPMWRANVGFEATFFGGLWLDFSLGIQKQGNSKATFSPGFNMFFGNPEKK